MSVWWRGAGVILAVTANCLLSVGADAASKAPLAVRQIAPDFKVVQITRDIYAFVSGNTTHLVEDGNTTVILTDEGVVVVDAPSTYLSTCHLAEIRKITNQPVKYLINTHWHGDHVFGNHVYKTAFPDIRIIANTYTAQISDDRNPQILADFYKGPRGKELLQQLKTQAEQGVDDKGKKLTSDYDRERARRSYREYVPAYEAELQGAYVAPNDTYDGQMVIKLGGKEIVLKTVMGHSKADTIVYVPDERVVITGDLVIAPVPYGINPFFDAWIAALDQLMAMPVDVYVPGHGDVQYTRDYLKLQRDLFQSLMAQARKATREGKKLDEFKKSLDLKAFEAKLVGGDPERQWGWDNYFMDGAPERALALAKGDL